MRWSSGWADRKLPLTTILRVAFSWVDGLLSFTVVRLTGGRSRAAA